MRVLYLLSAHAKLLRSEPHMVEAFHKLNHSLVPALVHSPDDGADILHQFINCHLGATQQAAALLRVHSGQFVKMDHRSFPLSSAKIFRSPGVRVAKTSVIASY